jgi:ubiquinol-cytochrome c reductase subunit 9
MIYNALFKRNSVFVSAIFLGAFSFSIGYDTLTSAWWDAHNRGVSFQPSPSGGSGRVKRAPSIRVDNAPRRGSRPDRSSRRKSIRRTFRDGYMSVMLLGSMLTVRNNGRTSDINMSKVLRRNRWSFFAVRKEEMARREKDDLNPHIHMHDGQLNSMSHYLSVYTPFCASLCSPSRSVALERSTPGKVSSSE